MIRKSLRKSSFIFGDPRVSLYVSSLTADHYFWCARVFLAVLRVFRGIMGCSGCSGGVLGCCEGVPGVFRVCSGCVPGCSGCVPGCSVVFRGVPGFTDTRQIVLVFNKRIAVKYCDIQVMFPKQQQQRQKQQDKHTHKRNKTNKSRSLHKN